MQLLLLRIQMIWVEMIMFRIVLLQKFYFIKKFELFSHKDYFRKNSLIATCYTLAKVKIRTSTQNRFTLSVSYFHLELQ